MQVLTPAGQQVTITPAQARDMTLPDFWGMAVLYNASAAALEGSGWRDAPQHLLGQLADMVSQYNALTLHVFQSSPQLAADYSRMAACPSREHLGKVMVRCRPGMSAQGTCHCVSGFCNCWTCQGLYCAWWHPLRRPRGASFALLAMLQEAAGLSPRQQRQLVRAFAAVKRDQTRLLARKRHLATLLQVCSTFGCADFLLKLSLLLKLSDAGLG